MNYKNYIAKTTQKVHLPEATFDTFIRKDENFDICALLKETVKASGYQLIWLYGKPATGKTHLLHALANFLLEEDKRLKVLLIGAERFTGSFIDSIIQNSSDKFINSVKSCDFLLIDDFHFLSSKGKTIEVLFEIIDEMMHDNKTMVFTSIAPFSEIEINHAQFLSRLKSAMPYQLNQPSINIRRQILKQIQNNFELNLSREALNYLARNISDTRVLQGALSYIHSRLNYDEQDRGLFLAREYIQNIGNKLL